MLTEDLEDFRPPKQAERTAIVAQTPEPDAVAELNRAARKRTAADLEANRDQSPGMRVGQVRGER